MEIAKPINVKISRTYAQKEPLIARSTSATAIFLYMDSPTQKEIP